MDTNLVDLAYSKAEQKEEAAEVKAPEPSAYSWGLCIRLERPELDKLGIKVLPGVGDEYHMNIVAEVTGVNKSSSRDKDDEACVALQIKMAQVTLHETAAEEEGEDETPASEAAETAKPRKMGILGA